MDALGLFPLASINRMESEFLSLCNYSLFVSAEVYTQYYMAVREFNNRLALGSHFNRFKRVGEDDERRRSTD